MVTGRYLSCDPYNWGCKRTAATEPVGRGPERPLGAGCHHGNGNTVHSDSGKPVITRKFCHSELVAATGGFSADSFLGKGSHGSVYRASLDGGRLTVAVKRAKLPAAGIFYENEIEILSRVRGPRLVNMIGVCDRDDSTDERLIVVEYMPNGCLYDLLHRSPRPPGWSDRIRYIMDVAKAVRSLHESDPPIIHRDIKSSNVLIDGKWRARLGDFGLALRGHVEDVRTRSTPPAGTIGYLDPAYAAPADLSEKSDVFSFGILLLEIISGRKAIDVHHCPTSIVDWALPLIRLQKFRSIFDSRVGPPPVDPSIVRLVAVLAARCVRGDARSRPCMAEVVRRLEIATKKVQAARRLWVTLTPCSSMDEAKEEAEVTAAEIGYCTRKADGERRWKVSSSTTASVSSSSSSLSVEYDIARGSGGSACLRRRQAAGSLVVKNKWVAAAVAVTVRLNRSRTLDEGTMHAQDYSREGMLFVGAGCRVTGVEEQSDDSVKLDGGCAE
ncbi:hypothetical protein SAY87_020606 [Trapa incisa]|uniref:Protein kinase domain-containing protein n=1 Tax=Trapa incisa TaxID=236973 RepID=A0AAN7JW00_9MYRT|nr:hypothetical protein SAY87_020606 [Trapa incisa]